MYVCMNVSERTQPVIGPVMLSPQRNDDIIRMLERNSDDVTGSLSSTTDCIEVLCVLTGCHGNCVLNYCLLCNVIKRTF